MSELNTVYIMSKGRPQCKTAAMFSTLKNYPRTEWFIVCGDNDETVGEYKRNWGEDRVLVFNWREWFEKCDMMDCQDATFGAIPARNAIHAISVSRGERRHWQFDDDYDNVAVYDKKQHRMRRLHDGEKVYRLFEMCAEFADKSLTDCANFGLEPTSTVFSGHRGIVRRMGKIRKRVFNHHNISNEHFIEWRGRLNDDLINSIWAKNHGKLVLSIQQATVHGEATQQTHGGLTEAYRKYGTVLKSAYAILASPTGARVVFKSGRLTITSTGSQ